MKTSTIPTPKDHGGNKSNQWIRVAASLMIVLLVIVTFEPPKNSNFVVFDDDVYVYKNGCIKEGLTKDCSHWPLSFESIVKGSLAIWHPLTWISLMLDHGLFGLSPMGYKRFLYGKLRHIYSSCWGYLLYVLVKMKKHPYLFVGWSLYLITILPAAGLVQLGHQASADGYTYIPLIDIFVMAIWGASVLLRHIRHFRFVMGIAVSALLLMHIMITRNQVGYWKDASQ